MQSHQFSPTSARMDAWNELGSPVPGSADAREAMRVGLLLGWNVRKTPMLAEVAPGQHIPLPGRYAVVRDSPAVPGQVDHLGEAGPSYAVLQNEDLCGLLDAVAEESGASFDTAGALDGGRRMFVTLKLPGASRIGGGLVEHYLAAVTGHDSKTAAAFMVTPVRVDSRATLNVAFGGASNAHRIRHTVNAASSLPGQAREALSFAFDYLDNFQKDAQRLAGAALTQNRFDEIISRAYGVPTSSPARTVTRTLNKLDQMAELFADLEGASAWDGLAALTEWADFHSPVRVGDVNKDPRLRARKAIFEPAFKNRALDLMLAES